MGTDREKALFAKEGSVHTAVAELSLLTRQPATGNVVANNGAGRMAQKYLGTRRKLVFPL